MNFEIIETPRMILQGLSPADMNYVFETFSKQEIKTLLGHRSEEDYQNEESKQKNGYASYNRKFILFLMTEKESNMIIGRCGIHNWNSEHKRAEIGYVIGDDRFKRNGFMTEALGAIIKYGFTKMNLNRLDALVGGENIPSLKLLKKFKFVKEGVMRQHYYTSGKFEDSILLSKLYDEYIRENNNATVH